MKSKGSESIVSEESEPRTSLSRANSSNNMTTASSSCLKLTIRVRRLDYNNSNTNTTDSTDSLLTGDSLTTNSSTVLYEVLPSSASDCSSSTTPCKIHHRFNKKKKKKKSKRKSRENNVESPLNGAKRLRLIVGNDTISIDIKKKLNF
jgi:hypothetical protein